MNHPLAPFLQPVRRLIHDLILPLPHGVRDFIMFGLKMAWSCLFAAIFLVLLILSSFFWQTEWRINRYDFLFISAILIQITMLATRLESFEELKVIMLYHVVGTIMEIFKTHVGSWQYPEDAFFRIGGVPLFTGFMYGTVGSFMARSIRIFEMEFTNYPKHWHTILVSFAIYLNFFLHHYFWDFRYVIFGILGILYFRTRIRFRPYDKFYSMPLLISAILSSFFMWVAENIGTFTRTWIYPQMHNQWELVSMQKMGSWFLLLFISFTMVMIVLKPQKVNQ